MKLIRRVPAELQAQVQAEQFRILRQHVPILYGVLLINTGILCFSVFGTVPTVLSIGVPSTFGALVLGRSAVWLTRRQMPASDAKLARYLFTTTLIAAFISLSLGIWGVALLHAGAGGTSFVPLFIALGSIACAYCLSSLPRAASVTIFLATTPVAFTLLTSGIRVEAAAGLNLLLVFVLILRLIAKQYDYLVGTVIAHSQAKSLAYIDPLTGLSNRRALIERMEETAEGRNLTTPIILAMVDLDGFKVLNDTYGHVVGDAVLAEAAQRIKDACSAAYTVARVGGDEFAALFIGINRLDDIGATLVQAMAAPFVVCGNRIRLSASIGLSTPLGPDQMPTALMLQADVALYEVKRTGGGGVRTFSPIMETRLHRRMAIEQALRATDPPPHIQVVYQPICDAKTRKIASFEALARWQHPDLGSVSPLEFISIAETTGTITALSEQIFSAAIEEAAGWDEAIGLSINLSAVQLSQPSTPLSIMSLCRRYGFDPRRLEVEVTETSVLADFTTARQQLELLRGAGIRIALDDFGAGYASISYLKEIAFDRIKIDGELIDNIVQSRKAAHLLHGILQLCSAVRAQVTAEKVETEEQAAILTGFGCDRLQGYLLGRPLPTVISEAASNTVTRAAG